VDWFIRRGRNGVQWSAANYLNWRRLWSATAHAANDI
jgi:hypothetical protein